MKNKYVYALDLSLNSTGVCIFTNDGEFVEAETIDTQSEKETKLKLKIIGEEFVKLQREYTPEVIVIEQGFTLYNQSTQAIFRVHGIVNYIFCNYEQVYYPATTVKKTITGRGNATKDEVREAILKQYPKVKFHSYDESDAYAVGLTFFIKKGIKNDLRNLLH